MNQNPVSVLVRKCFYIETFRGKYSDSMPFRGLSRAIYTIEGYQVAGTYIKDFLSILLLQIQDSFRGWSTVFRF